MQEKNVKCPLEVISFQGQQICYDPSAPGYAPRVFGTGHGVELTPELQAVIEAEEARQQQKRGRAGGAE